MLSIRMTRVGSKKKPYFRVVVTEARSALQSSFVENLGTYNPRVEAGEGGDQQGAPAALAEARARRPSDSVRTLLAKHLTRDLSAPVDGAGRTVMADASNDATASREPAARGGRSGGPRAGRSSPTRCRSPRSSAARHDGAGADDRAGRHGQDHRAAGTHGRGAAHAGRGDGREARGARAAGYPGLTWSDRDQGSGIGSQDPIADRRSRIPMPDWDDMVAGRAASRGRTASAAR